MRTKEIKGNSKRCPECGSERISFYNEVDVDEEGTELSLSCFCLDCNTEYDLVFVFAGRIIVEDEE